LDDAGRPEKAPGRGVVAGKAEQFALAEGDPYRHRHLAEPERHLAGPAVVEMPPDPVEDQVALRRQGAPDVDAGRRDPWPGRVGGQVIEAHQQVAHALSSYWP